MITAGPELFSEALSNYQVLSCFNHICACHYKFKRMWAFPAFREALIEEARQLVGDKHPEVPNPEQASLFPFEMTKQEHREYRIKLLQKLVETNFTITITKYT